MPEQITITPEVQKEIVSHLEKWLVIGIFGLLAIIFALNGNLAAATGFATSIATYVMSRQGV